MRPYLTLLFCASTFLFTAAPARAEDSPPPAPAGQQTPAPAPAPAENAGAPKVTARKEETDEASAIAENTQKREGFFAALFGNGKKKAAAADGDDLAAARDRIASLEKQNAALQKQLAFIDANWPAIEAALTQGNADDPALQTDLGKKVADITMKTAAAQVHAATGHDPKKLPGPGAAKPDAGRASAESDGKPLGRRELAAANAAYWAARNAPWATQN